MPPGRGLPPPRCVRPHPKGCRGLLLLPATRTPPHRRRRVPARPPVAPAYAPRPHAGQAIQRVRARRAADAPRPETASPAPAGHSSSPLPPGACPAPGATDAPASARRRPAFPAAPATAASARRHADQRLLAQGSQQHLTHARRRTPAPCADGPCRPHSSACAPRNQGRNAAASCGAGCISPPCRGRRDP